MPVTPKPRLTIAFIGPSGGKSTLFGQLLFMCGAIDQRTVNRYERDSMELNGVDRKFAWISDQLHEERMRQHTITSSNWMLETSTFKTTIIDTPASYKHLKNMVSGLTCADVAIFVISCRPDDHQEKHLLQRDAVIASSLGMKHVITVVNKMDAEGYSQTRYTSVQEEAQRVLTAAGFKPTQLSFLPAAGLVGDNVVQASASMPWHSGPTLLQAIDSVPPMERPVNKPFRCPISIAYRISGIGTVAVGKVAAGTIKPAGRVTISGGRSDHHRVDVNSVEQHHCPVYAGKAGDYVAMNLIRVSARTLKRGMMISSIDDPSTNCVSFSAMLFVVGAGRYRVGQEFRTFSHTANASCRLERIIRRMDASLKPRVVEEDPAIIEAFKGDIVMAELVPKHPLCVEKFSDYPSLGRVILTSQREVIAVGVIKDVRR